MATVPSGPAGRRGGVSAEVYREEDVACYVKKVKFASFIILASYLVCSQKVLFSSFENSLLCIWSACFDNDFTEMALHKFTVCSTENQKRKADSLLCFWQKSVRMYPVSGRVVSSRWIQVGRLVLVHFTEFLFAESESNFAESHDKSQVDCYIQNQLNEFIHFLLPRSGYIVAFPYRTCNYNRVIFIANYIHLSANASPTKKSSWHKSHGELAQASLQLCCKNKVRHLHIGCCRTYNNKLTAYSPVIFTDNNMITIFYLISTS